MAEPYTSAALFLRQSGVFCVIDTGLLSVIVFCSHFLKLDCFYFHSERWWALATLDLYTFSTWRKSEICWEVSQVKETTVIFSLKKEAIFAYVMAFLPLQYFASICTVCTAVGKTGEGVEIVVQHLLLLLFLFLLLWFLSYGLIFYFKKNWLSLSCRRLASGA